MIGDLTLVLRLLLVGFVSILLAESAHARGASRLCRDAFTADAEKLIDLYRQNKGANLTKFRENALGSWVLTPSGHWVRYLLTGEPGPIHLHLEGLGGQIETSSSSKILNELKLEQRVLVIELEGQGKREVLRRLELDHRYSEDTRFIDFTQNVDVLIEALHLISRQENFALQDISTWTGHSFGGMTVSSLVSRLNLGFPVVEQLFATGVTNFNNRLLDPVMNSHAHTLSSGISVMSSLSSQVIANIGLFTMGPARGIISNIANQLIPDPQRLAIQDGLRTFSSDQLFAQYVEDIIKMEAMAGLTLGAVKVDAVKDPSTYPKGSKIQIFSGEADMVVFAMLHWEMAVASIKAGHSTSLVLVEGVDHYLPQNMTDSQVATVNRMAKFPEQYEGFYVLDSTGQLQIMDTPQKLQGLLTRFKDSSLATWNYQEKNLRKVFGNFAEYPKTWRH